MKLLIVDDEPIEREGMKQILTKAFPDVTILEARDGYDAIAYVETEYPDIVFLDIMMPGINGIDTLQEIVKIAPTIRSIMVTAFDTFEYAQQAIRLGVNDYLLKPSKRAEIIQTVGKVIDLCVEDEKRLIADKQAHAIAETELVTQLIFHHVHDVQLDALLNRMNMADKQQVFVMTIYLTEPSDKIYTKIKRHVHSLGSTLVGALYNKQLPIIIFRNDTMTFRAQALPFAQSMISLLRDEQDVFIGIGEEVKQLDHATESYRQSVMALASNKQAVRFRFYEDHMQTLQYNQTNQIRQNEKLFFEALELGDWKRIESLFVDFLNRHEQQNVPLIFSQQRLLELFWVIQRALENLGLESTIAYLSFQSSTYRQLHAEMNGILSQISFVYNSHLAKAESNKIMIVKRYIEEHSHEEISLDMLAQLIDFTPMYLSKLFKEQMGINYIDFLTECRIAHAKQLLKDSEKSLKEITFEIGYHEPNYFSKVFKKFCGLSPTDYRKQIVMHVGADK